MENPNRIGPTPGSTGSRKDQRSTSVNPSVSRTITSRPKWYTYSPSGEYRKRERGVGSPAGHGSSCRISRVRRSTSTSRYGSISKRSIRFTAVSRFRIAVRPSGAARNPRMRTVRLPAPSRNESVTSREATSTVVRCSMVGSRK